MTEPAAPDQTAGTSRSPARVVAAFAGLLVLYLAPAVVGVLVLLLVAGRQADANAFRYVGF